ncbi:hypothetical protein [Tsuneonella sp. HG222]
MGFRIYLPIGFAVFVAATTGADVFARMTIAGESLGVALGEHLYWAGVQVVATLLLLAPFIGIPFLCHLVEKKARRRGVIGIFSMAMIALFFFYFQGYQGAQVALLEGKWTASTLSVGLLPFFIGLPVFIAACGVGALAIELDPRKS